MSSHNIKDIVGLGEIVGHVKDFILKIIEYRVNREERRLSNEDLKLNNARKFLEIASKYNLTPEQLKFYIDNVNGKQEINTKPVSAQAILPEISDNEHIKLLPVRPKLNHK